MSWFHKKKKLTPKKVMSMSIEEIIEIGENELSVIEDRNVLAILFCKIFIHMTGEQIKVLKTLRKKL